MGQAPRVMKYQLKISCKFTLLTLYVSKGKISIHVVLYSLSLQLVFGDDIKSKAVFVSTFLGNTLFADPTSGKPQHQYWMLYLLLPEFALKKLLTIDDVNIVVNVHTDSGLEDLFGFFDMVRLFPNCHL